MLITSDELFSFAQALLLSETQKGEEAKQSYTVAQAKNEQLTKKLGDAEKNVDQLQDSVHRFVSNSLDEGFHPLEWGQRGGRGVGGSVSVGLLVHV